MSFRHLEIFVKVVEASNMSKAAKQLNISQPSVSQAIADLERQYNVQLFERLSHKLYLTHEGEHLLSYARHILDSYQQMEAEMSAANKKKLITIGCSVSVGTCYIHPLLQASKQQLDNCEFKIIVSNTSEIEQLLLANKIDIGIVEGELNHPSIVRTPLCLDELVLVCGQTHPLSFQSSIPITALQGQAYLSRESGSSDKNQYEHYLEQQHIELQRTFYSTNTEAIKNAAKNGLGIAIFSSKMIEKEVQEGSLCILPIKNVHITRNIQFIIHKDKFMSNELKQLKKLCINVLI